MRSAFARHDAAVTFGRRGLPTLSAMALADLIVLNRKVSGGAPTALLPDACVVATCLREVRVAVLTEDEQPTTMEARAAGYERHAGIHAYRFLLQLACG